MANASQLLNDDMTLEEKLKAISDMMEEAQAQADAQAQATGQASAPVDPATFTICDGCE